MSVFRRAGAVLTIGGLLAFGVATTAAAMPSGTGPYKAVHTFERHFGQLKLVPAAEAAKLPHSHLPEGLRLSHTVAHTTSPAVSSNWAGYAESVCGTCADRYIAADFTLASANCKATPDTVYASWVGLDGLTDNTVEQTGVDVFCVGTVAEYYAWYEMYPAATVFYSLAASPGDNINVNVYKDWSTGLYSLTLQDTTLGAGFDTTATCPTGSVCQDKSAEVITEAFSIGTVRQPLADFGQVNYNGARWTSRNGSHFNMESGPLATSYAIRMDNTHFTAVDALPGPLTDGVSGGIPVSDFSTVWVASS